MRFLLMLFIALVVQMNTASAYLVGSFGDKKLDPSQETHIFVIGYGRDMGTQFAENAISTARRLQEAFPNRQYLFLLQPERGAGGDTALMKRFGVNVISYDKQDLLGANVVKAIIDYRRIASLEFFSHGHAVYGAALVGKESSQRFWQGTPGIEKLKGAFIKNGYVLFHGCNAGFVTGPKVSRILGVPVAGHLTGSNFQQPFLNQDGTTSWFFNDKGLYPATSKFAGTNTLSFKQDRSCSAGNCSRLVADPHTYNGDYGRYTAGLGFRKFYCAYNYGDECFAAMATALMGFPSVKPLSLKSSAEDYALVVKDLLCPADVTGEKRAACFAAIKSALNGGSKEMSFFRGGEPVCELDGCHIKATCKERDCSIKADNGETSQKNLMNEYSYYMKGYRALIGVNKAKTQDDGAPGALIRKKPAAAPAVKKSENSSVDSEKLAADLGNAVDEVNALAAKDLEEVKPAEEKLVVINTQLVSSPAPEAVVAATVAEEKIEKPVRTGWLSWLYNLDTNKGPAGSKSVRGR